MAKRDVRELLPRPLVVAPMGAGPSTVALVVAAAGAGAFGFLAAGYKTPAAVATEIAAVKTATSEPFGVNLFVPGAPATDAEALTRYLDSLAGESAAVDAALADASWDDDAYEQKVAVLLADPPAMVSFTFGLPSPEVIAAFRAVGTFVTVTITHSDEAAAAAAAGVDALVVQGCEAGAHSGAFANDGTSGRDTGVVALVGEVTRVTDLPQFAAGGIMGPDNLAAVLAAGAVAAQCGTAFLRCPESGAHPVYKAALADPRFITTAVTRAFSGRPARGLLNRFMLDHPDAPAAYPEINNATRPVRARAAAAGDPDRMSLWAGQGYRAARDRPAGEVIDALCL